MNKRKTWYSILLFKVSVWYHESNNSNLYKSFYLWNSGQGKTCSPALGYSFAAGTIDGPGAFDFTQGMTSGNPFWNMVVGFIHDPEPEQVECHAPKPILLDTGHVSNKCFLYKKMSINFSSFNWMHVKSNLEIKNWAYRTRLAIVIFNSN